MMDARPRHLTKPAPKGAPTPDSHGAPAREWTTATVEEECATLEAARRDALTRGDEEEVRRIDARLRLLRDETA
jgi:hypothetical protein